LIAASNSSLTTPVWLLPVMQIRADNIRKRFFIQQ
jgi:hypothetical protein